MKKILLSALLAGIWINVSEFLRNEVLFKSYWLTKYQGLDLTFPSEPINASMWVVWAFIFGLVIAYLSTKLNAIQTTIVTWIIGFVLMWVVLWNLAVLPKGLLLIAAPWSFMEVYIASIICQKVIRKSN
jgi:hypothetical protein